MTGPERNPEEMISVRLCAGGVSPETVQALEEVIVAAHRALVARMTNDSPSRRAGRSEADVEAVLKAAQQIAKEAMAKAVLGVLASERRQLLRDMRSIPRVKTFQSRYWEGKFDGLRDQLTKVERRIEEAKRQVLESGYPGHFSDPVDDGVSRHWDQITRELNLESR